MVDDKKGDSKKLLMGLALVVILVCVAAAAAYLVLFSGVFNGSSAVENVMDLKPAGKLTVTDDQLSATKGVLLARFTEYGYKVTINTMHDDRGAPYLQVKYGDIPSDVMTSIVTTPGMFEMRIQTQGNESEHILYGDDVQSVSVPTSEKMPNGSEAWGVSFRLTEAGAAKFRQACIDSGATDDPASHPVIMLLDDKVFYEQPISPQLASDITTKPVDTLMAMTGTGDNGSDMARKVSMCLKAGAMPVKMEIVSI
jgi:preprotein translocase subunit SecD